MIHGNGHKVWAAREVIWITCFGKNITKILICFGIAFRLFVLFKILLLHERSQGQVSRKVYGPAEFSVLDPLNGITRFLQSRQKAGSRSLTVTATHSD